MAEIHAAKIHGTLAGGQTVSRLFSVSGTASAAFATTTITGDIRLTVLGTFNSATVSLQIIDPNGVYAEVSGSPITAAKQAAFTFPQNCRNVFRVSKSQASDSTNLSVWVQGSNG